MKQVRPLPADLTARFRDWKSSGYPEKRELFQKLVDEGQSPRGMVISCCDSRVQVTSLFNADPGDFFIHRNIANFVPAHGAGDETIGTAAALQYAITALKVPHLIVVGHSQCGGVAGCHALCEGAAPELEAPDNFVGRWIDHLRPAHARIDRAASPEAQLRDFEKQGVILSLENLLTYPFVAEACAAGALELHGLWTDIAGGELHQYDPETGRFAAL
ncbi:MAG: carbonic anhydrase [Silicimonas sp.]|nr:carbonic anhydrase [Silicimonas sp.]